MENNIFDNFDGNLYTLGHPRNQLEILPLFHSYLKDKGALLVHSPNSHSFLYDFFVLYFHDTFLLIKSSAHFMSLIAPILYSSPVVTIVR